MHISINIIYIPDLELLRAIYKLYVIRKYISSLDWTLKYWTNISELLFHFPMTVAFNLCTNQVNRQYNITVVKIAVRRYIATTCPVREIMKLRCIRLFYGSSKLLACYVPDATCITVYNIEFRRKTIRPQ